MAGIDLKALKCPSCGAVMPPIDPAATSVTCGYCGLSFQVTGAKAPPKAAKAPQAPRPAPEPRPPRVPPKPTEDRPATPPPEASSIGGIRGLIGCVAGLIPVVATVALAVGGLFVLKWYQDQNAVLEPVNPTAAFGFVDQYAAPVTADVDGDGRADLLALHVRSGGPELAVWLGAYDGETMAERWAVGPFGTREEATRKIGISVVGDRVVLQEPFANVAWLDLRSGKRLGTVTLAENPFRTLLCQVATAQGPRVILDHRQWLDPVSGTTTPHRNGDCPGRRHPGDSADYAEHLAESVPTPRLDGLAASSAWADGAHGVVRASTTRGRPGTVLLGFDKKSQAERWRMDVGSVLSGVQDDTPSLLDIADGTVIFAVGRRVAFLDASTGAVRSRLTLPSGDVTTARFDSKEAWISVIRWPKAPVYRVDVASGEILSVFGSP